MFCNLSLVSSWAQSDRWISSWEDNSFLALYWSMQAYLGLNKASKGFNFSFPTLKLIFSTEMKLHGNKAARSTLILSILKTFVYSKYLSCNGSIFNKLWYCKQTAWSSWNDHGLRELPVKSFLGIEYVRKWFQKIVIQDSEIFFDQAIHDLRV